MEKRGGDPTEEIEEEVLEVAEDVFDIVAVDPEEPHIADEVQPSAMEEHASKDINPLEAAGYKAIFEQEMVEGEFVEGEFVEEGEHIESD